jgi:hypothetical protein
MERHLGRSLEPWEIVHHKDGNKLNNAIENLEIMDFSAHAIEHNTGSRKSYDTRRSMEAFANLREELKRERSIRAELLEVATDSLECSEILVSMIDSIRSNGNYSEESTLIFLMQAHQCLSKAPAAIAKATGGKQ